MNHRKLHSRSKAKAIDTRLFFFAYVSSGLLLIISAFYSL